MNKQDNPPPKPEILAPAGDENSYLAAIAAGADAIYCGLKNYSARMEAENLSLSQLSSLIPLARKKGIKTYLALNNMLKSNEPLRAGRLLERMNQICPPDAIIFQDPAVPEVARQAGYKGELHLSTLANMSFGAGLATAAKLGASRVVLPRELSIDEIKSIASSCPDNLSLEVFVHGALCYAVSGRCYWSSFLGGKSGLRGRCVQPCRRQYSQKGSKGSSFSCMDLRLGHRARLLIQVPKVRTWKIEGRKKGPHYVYYTTKAYTMLRDDGKNPKTRKAAEQLLEMALGRPGSSYNFLPQRSNTPLSAHRDNSSGRFLGRLQGHPKSLSLRTREELLPGDLLRFGNQENPGHFLLKIRAHVPCKGTLTPRSRQKPIKGTPVYLLDRREPELDLLIKNLCAEVIAPEIIEESNFELRKERPFKKSGQTQQLLLNRIAPNHIPPNGNFGIWINPARPSTYPRRIASRIWYMLSPVIWPDEEQKWKDILTKLQNQGARRFILNSPWQISLFDQTDGLDLWAGPYCNIANGVAVSRLKKLGFKGVIVSPELDRDTVLGLPAESSLPLGIVTSAIWPLCISRTAPDDLKISEPFASPKDEEAWTVNYGPNYWTFPGWPLDLTAKRRELQKAGYSYLLDIRETIPAKAKLKKRPGNWNWDLKLI